LLNTGPGLLSTAIFHTFRITASSALSRAQSLHGDLLASQETMTCANSFIAVLDHSRRSDRDPWRNNPPPGATHGLTFPTDPVDVLHATSLIEAFNLAYLTGLEMCGIDCFGSTRGEQLRLEDAQSVSRSLRYCTL
jgi:hypothetical protein